MSKFTLIIGSRGSLGQDLLAVFPHTVAWDRSDLDVTNEFDVVEKITKLQPQIVINATAYNAVDECEKSTVEHKKAEDLNGRAPGFLAHACAQVGATFVHYSTNYVFYGTHKAGYTESDKPNPVNTYGLTKLLGERNVQAVPHLNYYLIRTSKLFGRQGASPFSKKNFFDIMCELVQDRDELRVVDEELSNFTYTPDLAQATQMLLTKHYEPGVYHLVNEQPATWYEGAQTLFDILGKRVTLTQITSEDLKRPARRPQYGVLLNTKFPKLRNYNEALKEYVLMVKSKL